MYYKAYLTNSVISMSTILNSEDMCAKTSFGRHVFIHLTAECYFPQLLLAFSLKDLVVGTFHYDSDR